MTGQEGWRGARQAVYKLGKPEDHATGVPGLYAIGEAASGLHGANRLGGNSLIELLVYGRRTGNAVADYAESLSVTARSAAAVGEARAENDALLAEDGPESVRALQRQLRSMMTEHCGVVRSEEGLAAGLAQLDAIEERAGNLGVHPDIAGYYDLAQALDLKASFIAARATLQSALERRETRGCHNRSDYPEQEAKLRVNMVWCADGTIEREPVSAPSEEIAALMREVSQDGKLVE